MQVLYQTMILPTPQSSLSIYFEGGRKEGGLYYSVNVQCIFVFGFVFFFWLHGPTEPQICNGNSNSSPKLQQYLATSMRFVQNGRWQLFLFRFVCLLLNVWVWFSIIWVSLIVVVVVVVGGIVGFHMENRTKKKKLCVKIFIFWLCRRLCFCLHSKKKKKRRELNIIDHQRENISTDDGYLANYGSNKSC